MKPKVGIGITTYKSITDTSIGESIYDLYADLSEHIVPNRICAWNKRHNVASREDFGSYWYNPTAYSEVAGKKNGLGVAPGTVLRRSQMQVGGEWSRTGRLSGEGRVHFRPEMENSQTNYVIINHSYSPKVDWLKFFLSLIELLEPSHGMLHLFTDREVPKIFDPYGFNRPFAGEGSFTCWRTSSGELRKPDRWQIQERRTYKYIPELSWANFLGPEFEGRYDLSAIAEYAYAATPTRGGALVQLSQDIRDVELKFDAFSEVREQVKSAFFGIQFNNLAVKPLEQP